MPKDDNNKEYSEISKIFNERNVKNSKKEKEEESREKKLPAKKNGLKPWQEIIAFFVSLGIAITGFSVAHHKIKEEKEKDYNTGISEIEDKANGVLQNDELKEKIKDYKEYRERYITLKENKFKTIDQEKEMQEILKEMYNLNSYLVEAENIILQEEIAETYNINDYTKIIVQCNMFPNGSGEEIYNCSIKLPDGTIIEDNKISSQIKEKIKAVRTQLANNQDSNGKEIYAKDMTLEKLINSEEKQEKYIGKFPKIVDYFDEHDIVKENNKLKITKEEPEEPTVEDGGTVTVEDRGTVTGKDGVTYRVYVAKEKPSDEGR